MAIVMNAEMVVMNAEMIVMNAEMIVMGVVTTVGVLVAMNP